MQVGATEHGGTGRFNEANTESSLLATVSMSSSVRNIRGGRIKTGMVTDRVDPEVRGHQKS